ncbi:MULTISPECIES: transporter substrate-binding domain-containing protein [unclassified Pseudoalteromonas]|uniref:substrate-binding periplasmic protein n=1 Tax=unclassified Pseudoalteromonas TaxID=194690 RepID=UPI0020978E28|nr:transporter substrate-binding domain-containing protein [Pseudoalteromonas sp. XMcav2-N]MCO7187451.1 transporter substrate-binding domain-containing protein [Pseudoalteromonas sp. XMcav2-N]
MRFFRYCMSFLLISVVCLAPYLALAQSCDQTVTVSASDNWPPYSYRVGEQYRGLDIEILELVLKHANLCWRYVSFPSSSRAFEEFKKGKVDVIFAASFTQERRKFSEFSVPYRDEVMQLFRHADNPLSPQHAFAPTLHFLTKSLVAVNRGSVYGEAFSRVAQQCPDCVVDINLATERFNLLVRKRVDYAVEDLFTGIYLINREPYKAHVRASRLTVHKNPAHYMIRPGLFSEKRLQQFNLAIERNRAAIDELIDLHFQRLLSGSAQAKP